MKFSEMKLSQYILDGLNKQHIHEATEIQYKCIPTIMSGSDVIGSSQTGSGKTYAFGIPALEMIDEEKAVQVLVVCPTRELALQVTEEIRKLSSMRENAKIVPLFGGNSMDRQICALKKNARIVVGTPGRIMDHIRRRTLKLEKVKLAVLDEADEMLDMGFREDIEEILKHTARDRQTVMFSATMPKPILEITKNYMHDPILIESENQGKAQTFIEQYYLQVERDRKQDAVKFLLDKFKPMRAIVFCNTKAMVDKLAKDLNERELSVVGLHGDMRQNERKRAIDAIKADRINVLIATDVAARGIDIRNVDMVINFDVPNNSDFYVHRIGRTARAGKAGSAYTIINTRAQLSVIEQLRKDTKNEIPEFECEYTHKLGGKKQKGKSSDSKPIGGKPNRDWKSGKKNGKALDSKKRYSNKFSSKIEFDDDMLNEGRERYSKDFTSESNSVGEKSNRDWKSSRPTDGRKRYSKDFTSESNSTGEKSNRDWKSSRPTDGRKRYSKDFTSESNSVGEKSNRDWKSSRPTDGRKRYSKDFTSESNSVGEKSNRDWKSSRPTDGKKRYSKDFTSETNSTGEKQNYGDKKTARPKKSYTPKGGTSKSSVGKKPHKQKRLYKDSGF